MTPLSIRKGLIDRGQGALSICHQCEMLGLARSTLYYTPAVKDEKDLLLMKELDRLYLEDSTRGTRRMAKERCKLGLQVRKATCAHFDANHAIKSKPSAKGIMPVQDHCFIATGSSSSSLLAG